MTHVTRAFRRTAVPLVFYYAVALVLPLVNGAARSGTAFTRHALIVLFVPPAVIVAGCAIRGGFCWLLGARFEVDTPWR
jgi:hypothetical protein